MLIFASGSRQASCIQRRGKGQVGAATSVDSWTPMLLCWQPGTSTWRRQPPTSTLPYRFVTQSIQMAPALRCLIVEMWLGCSTHRPAQSTVRSHSIVPILVCVCLLKQLLLLLVLHHLLHSLGVDLQGVQWGRCTGRVSTQ